MKNENLDKLFPDKRNKEKTKFDKLKYVELRMLKIFDHLCEKNKINYSLIFGTLLGAIRHKGFIPWDDDIDVIMTLEDYNKFLKHVGKLPESIFFQTTETDKIKMGPPFLAKLRCNNSKVEFEKQYNSGAFLDIFLLNKVSSNKIISFFQKRFLILIRTIYRAQNDEEIFKNKNYKKFLKGILFLPKNFFKIFNFANFLQRVYLKIFNESENDKYCLHWHKSNPLVINKEEIFPTKKVIFEKDHFQVLKNSEKILKYLYGNYMKLPPKSKQKPSHFNLDKIEI